MYVGGPTNIVEVGALASTNGSKNCDYGAPIVYINIGGQTEWWRWMH